MRQDDGLGLPFFGGPTSRPYLFQYGGVGVGAGYVALDRLAHVQHPAQRVYVAAAQAPELAGP